MDIAKVRKKIKQLKASSEQKNEDVLQKEKTENAQETADVKPDTKPTPDRRNERDGKGLQPAAVEIEADETPVIEIIAFKLADEECAVKISEMQEILRYQKIAPVPRSPEYLKGITFLRGKILPVIDLKERLGLKGKIEGRQKIIVLAASKEPVGVLVGSVMDVVRFPETELLQPPATLNDKEKSFIEGVVKVEDRFISLLNVDEIVNMEAI